MSRLSILYFSVHSILEYDDMLMFTEAGHKVFSLGAYQDPATAPTEIRPPRDSFFQLDLLAELKNLGYITREFVKKFDIVFVNHDAGWVLNHLEILGDIPVIYRSIGQSNLGVEDAVRALGERVKVVRYSERERHLAGFAKTDKVIYFGKDVDRYEQWVGGGSPITFHNQYKMRDFACVPVLSDYQAISAGFGTTLFGIGNDEISNWGGCLTFDEMLRAYRSCSCYLYVWTVPPSYTLSLVEAMLIGAPVVAPSSAMVDRIRGDWSGTWHPSRYEVPALLDDEHQLLFDDVAGARRCLEIIGENRPETTAMAGRVRTRARAIFDMRKIGAEWDSFFAEIL